MLETSDIEALIRRGVPMAEDIGFRVQRTQSHFARTWVPFNDRLVRPGGTLSGPVQMTLADASMYAAILATVGKVEMAVTSNLNINFMERPAPADLYAEAIVLRMGRRLAFCEVRLLSGEDETLVSHVTGSYAMPGRPATGSL